MAAVITWCLDLAGLVTLCGVAVTPPVCQPLCHLAELMLKHSFGEKGRIVACIQEIRENLLEL